MSPRPILVPTLALLCGAAIAAEAAPAAPAPAGTGPASEVLVVVGSSQTDAARLPGTATVLDPDLLDVHHHDSVHQILRQVPAANVVDEDGYGLRANIGLRGVNPVRSTKVHLMEDGVPIAPNPYNDPSLYVSPAYGRFQAIEVIKGSGQILYGPHTVAGVVNLKTAPLAYERRAAFDVAAGSHDTVRGSASLEVPLAADLTAAIDLYGIDSSGFRPHDDVSQTEVVARLGWRSDGHRLEAKLFHGAENSGMTYVGLSREDYRRNPYHRYAFSADDGMEAVRRGVHLRHRWDFAAAGNLVTTAYAQAVDRGWNRAYFSNAGGNYVGSLSGGTYDRRDNARRYHAGGLETRFHDRYGAGVPLAVDAGLRLHGEGQTNRVVDRVAATSALAVRSSVARDTVALAGWLQLDAEVLRGVHLIPGVRVEHVRLASRRTVDNFAATTDPEGDSSLSEALPGFGFTADLGGTAQLYGGVHRGFSPPSYSQAISGSGEDAELDAETSWNYELGLRLDHGPALRADLAAFYVDWENIVAQGVSGGPQINAGRSTHYGAELLIESDLGRATGLGYGLPLRLAAAHVTARYDTDAYSGATLVAEKGNDREFSPDLTLSATIGVEGIGPHQGFHAFLTVNHIGSQYSDGLNTEAVNPAGDRGRIDAVTLFDATVKWRPADANYEFYLGGRNLLDTAYVAYRRGGHGTIAGPPLTALAGLAATF